MKVGIVNVGTIGHVDHGRSSLASALLELGHEVVFLDAEQVEQAKDLGLLLDVQTPEHERGRRPDLQRKAERKAHMRGVQRRAFEGGRP